MSVNNVLSKKIDFKDILLEVADFDKKTRKFKLKVKYLEQYNHSIFNLYPKLKEQVNAKLVEKIQYLKKSKEID